LIETILNIEKKNQEEEVKKKEESKLEIISNAHFNNSVILTTKEKR
jgi:hypothetical protein